MEAGEIVGGRYRLVAPLASGGMGTVWRARHVELDSEVAVKVMSDALLRAPTALARFQREARAAAQLQSPHVVQVFDYGVHEGRPYLAMELLAGEDLKGYLDRHGALPLGRAAQIVDAVAKGLRVAHASGIVHRDLKPANVFLAQLGGDEIVKILDFGIAKDLAPQPDALRTSSSTVVGSPLYMSPEQVRGAEVGPATDLWALAVVAFEMVAGRQPFEGASLGDVFARIVADRIPVVSSFRAGLPPTVDAFFAKALSREPGGRFGDAPALAQAFRRAVEGEAVRDVPTQVAAALAPRVSPDVPTLADAPDPQEAGDPPAPPARSPSAAPARTNAEEPTRELELARTVATPAPRGEEQAPPRSRRLLLLGALLVAALGVALVVGRGDDPIVPGPATGSESERRVGAPPSSPPAEAPSPPAGAASAEPTPEPTPEPIPSASVSAPAVVPSGPAPPRAPASPARTARPPGGPGPAATPAPTAGPSGPAVDPIFGVPVRR